MNASIHLKEVLADLASTSSRFGWLLFRVVKEQAGMMTETTIRKGLDAPGGKRIQKRFRAFPLFLFQPPFSTWLAGPRREHVMFLLEAWVFWVFWDVSTDSILGLVFLLQPGNLRLLSARRRDTVSRY